MKTTENSTLTDEDYNMFARMICDPASVNDALVKAFKLQEHKNGRNKMNIAQLLKALDKIDGDSLLTGVSREICSYRGYYEHLAIAPSIGRRMYVVEFYNLIAEQIGKTYSGWKGGEYKMSGRTELFIATRGDCGLWVIGLSEVEDGLYSLETSDTDMNGF